MFLVNIIAQIIIAGGGPGACIGCVGLPYIGIVTAYLTHKLFVKNG